MFQVPDRGGRSWEQAPPPPEMPSWQTRPKPQAFGGSGAPRGGGGGRGGQSNRGGFGGGGRGGFDSKKIYLNNFVFYFSFQICLHFT